MVSAAAFCGRAIYFFRIVGPERTGRGDGEQRAWQQMDGVHPPTDVQWPESARALRRPLSVVTPGYALDNPHEMQSERRNEATATQSTVAR